MAQGPEISNQRTSGAEDINKQKRRRGYKACERCRSQKAKCDMGDPDAPQVDQACKRCRREGRICTFPPDSGRKYARKLGVSRPTYAVSSPLEKSISSHLPKPEPIIPTNPDESLIASDLHNPNDALRLLSLASIMDTTNSPHNPHQNLRPATIHLTSDPDQAGTGKGWKEFPPISEGIISISEAHDLFNKFRTQMHPLYPLLPNHVFEQLYLPTLWKAEYLLLATMITIAARYIPASSPTMSERNHQIHLTMLRFCRENISYIMDGSPAMRHISSVEVLLLFAEWPGMPLVHPHITGPADKNDGSNLLRPSMIYDSLSWTYIGCAMRLAQELGLDDPIRYAADATVTPIGSWAQNTWAQERALQTWLYAYNADRHVSVRLGRNAVSQTHMSSEWWEAVCSITSNKYHALSSITDDADKWAEPMPEGFIATVLGTIQDRLYPSREMTRSVLKTGYWEGFLRSLNLEIENMKRQSASILCREEFASWLLRIEIDYCGLYAGTISLRALQLRTERRLRANDIFSRSATLLNLQEGPWILASLEHATSILRTTVEKLGSTLHLAPARLFQRILFAATFLFKALAVGVVEHGKSIIIQLLEKTVEALEMSTNGDEQRISHGFAALLKRLQLHFPETSSDGTEDSNRVPVQNLQVSTATGVEEFSPFHPLQWDPTNELLALGKEQDALFQTLWSSDAGGFGTNSHSFSLVETLCMDDNILDL